MAAKRKKKNNSQGKKIDDEVKLDREVCVIHCIASKMTLAASLEYMKSKGHEIEKSVYYEIKSEIMERRTKAGHKIASGGLFEQHMVRIENLEDIEREYWNNYHKEPNPLKKSVILEKIQNIQPFISSAYDYIKEIMFEQDRLRDTSFAYEPEPGDSRRKEKPVKISETSTVS